MRVELLYFGGCPSYLVAEERLRIALVGQGLTADIEMIHVETDEAARNLRFLSSPTIRVDGQDLFPGGEQHEGALGCRVYLTPEGLSGSPTVEMLTQALGRPRPDPTDRT